MTVKGRFSFDTNILVYAVYSKADERYELSKGLIGRVARHDCVLTVQALAEFFHATTRKGLLGSLRAGAFVRGWLNVFQVTSVDDAALVDAMDAAAEHRLSFWDATLWATARRAGCSVILTEDMQDGRRLSGVEFINPFAVDAPARLAALFEASGP